MREDSKEDIYTVVVDNNNNNSITVSSSIMLLCPRKQQSLTNSRMLGGQGARDQSWFILFYTVYGLGVLRQYLTKALSTPSIDSQKLMQNLRSAFF